VVLVDRPEPFAPAPPLSDVERDLEILSGFFTLLGIEEGGTGLSENRLLTEMLDSAAAAIRQCVKKLERGDVIAETLSKKEVVDCVQDLGWSLDALFILLKHAKWTLEIYEKSAYSQGLKLGASSYLWKRSSWRGKRSLGDFKRCISISGQYREEFLFPEVTKL
jgi:V/A-type H+-transporting ATPase subunit I